MTWAQQEVGHSTLVSQLCVGTTAAQAPVAVEGKPGDNTSGRGGRKRLKLPLAF